MRPGGASAVVVAAGVATPLGLDLDTFWSALCTGVDGISTIERFRVDDLRGTGAPAVDVDAEHLRRGNRVADLEPRLAGSVGGDHHQQATIERCGRALGGKRHGEALRGGGVTDEREGHGGKQGALHGRLRKKLRAKLRGSKVDAMRPYGHRTGTPGDSFPRVADVTSHLTAR